jgi:hypothetical protein
MDSDNSWIRYLIERGQRLAAWQGKQQEMRQLAEQSIYIRVGGGQFRAVSIHPNNPCGRLRRKETGKDIGGTKGLDSALKSAREAASADTVKPNNRKSEHVVQAGLIHHALTHDLLLNDRFSGFAEFFDDLIFITDELKVGDVGGVRADILALGRKDGVYFPVFIELKAERSFERVVGQLLDAQGRMATVRDSFIDMLASATGNAARNIAFNNYKLVVAWPETRSGKEKASPLEAVNKQGNESAKGHLLIGQFKRPESPRDGFNSVIHFSGAA